METMINNNRIIQKTKSYIYNKEGDKNREKKHFNYGNRTSRKNNIKPND